MKSLIKPTVTLGDAFDIAEAELKLAKATLAAHRAAGSPPDILSIVESAEEAAWCRARRAFDAYARHALAARSA